MTQSLVTNLSFGSVEQLSEMFHTMGWDTEYRQLKPGAFSSSFAVLEGESWFLAEEQSSCLLESQAPAPQGMYALALVEGEPGTFNSQPLTDDRIVVQGPGSEYRVTMTAGMKIPQIGIETEKFEELVRAVAPELAFPRDGAFSFSVAPGHCSDIRQAMRSLLLSPPSRRTSRQEAIARILTCMVQVIAASGGKPSGRRLHRAASLQALNRAKEYIDAFLGRTIRVADLCRHSGTSLSTLERSFVRELGVTPQLYVKARRLNAVRSRLLAMETEQDHGVTEIALGFGFTHLGRFAGEYHTFFGEYPRETLRGR